MDWYQWQVTSSSCITDAPAIIYYAPTIFKQIGLSGGTIGLLATGVVGIVNFVLTIPAVLFVDMVGRKPLLIWGEANMTISHAVVAALIAVYSNPKDDTFSNKKAGNAAIFMSECLILRGVVFFFL